MAVCQALWMLVSLYDWFWKDHHWFPSQYSWADFEDKNEEIYPHPKDLLAVIPLALVIIIVRYSFERVVGLPLGRLMGVYDGHRIKAFHNSTLESFFRTQDRNPKEAQLNHLATQCNLSMRQVQHWFRCRRNQERPLRSKKFSEACWKCMVYTFSFVGGFFILYDEPWLWDSDLCWHGFPKQIMKPSIYWWYLLDFGHYISLLLTLPFDVKRKDFTEQVIHHFSAAILIYFSYCANYIRIGTLVIFIHDVADIFLEAGKVLHYAQWKQSCDMIFIIFSMTFFITRLIVFPYKVLYSTYYSSMVNHEPFFGYYFTNGLLMILQALHVFWSYLILCMLFRYVNCGTMEKDVRSDVEEQDTSDDDQLNTKEQKSKRLQSSDVPDTYNLPRSRGARRTGPN
uniref:Ceramide synthase 4-like n=1 Tax=Monodelphis domestica TaxID=13616 RepID=F7CKQ0_MONDO